MSRSAESRAILRQFHKQQREEREQARIQQQSQSYHAYPHAGAPPPPPPPPLDESTSTEQGDLRSTKSRKVPMNPNLNSSYNMNTMLYNNIIDSDYFKALNEQLTTFNDVILEIKASVNHVEPFQGQTGSLSTSPSTAYSLLLKGLDS